MDLQPYILPVATLLGGWFIGKGKRKADTRLSYANADKSEVEAVEQAVKIWRELAEKFRIEVDTLRKTVDELKVEVEELRAENIKLKIEINQLKITKIN